MNKLKLRQLYLFLAGMLPLGKLILYPSTLAGLAESDLLFSALLSFLVEGAVVWSILFLSSKTDKTFYELLENTFGEIVARIVYGVFALYFLFYAILPITEQSLLIRSAFFDTQISPFVILPFFFLSLYLCTKGYKMIGRSADLLAPLGLVCLIGILGFAFGSTELTNLLPVGKHAADIPKASLFTLNWFSDGALLLFLLGHYRYEKGGVWKGMLCYAIGAVLVLLMLAAFYGIFSTIAIRQNGGFSRIGKYFPGLTTLGRVDYLLIYLVTLPMLFYVTLPLQICVECLEICFRWQKRIPLSVIVNLLAMALVFLSQYLPLRIETLVNEKLWFFFLLFSYLIPVLAWTLRRKS